MTRGAIRFLRQGRVVEIAPARPDTTLLDWLRLEEGARGTKEGCAEGDCGACTVVLARLRDGAVVFEPVNACILPLGSIDGAELITVEDLAEGPRLHEVQQAMVDKHGSQCGFCTPGIVMSLFALYHEGERPIDRAAVTDALAGNLCRCTGYRPIIEAALEACAEPSADRFAREREERSAALAALQDPAEDVVAGTPERFFAAPASEAVLRRLLGAYPDARLVAGATDLGLALTKELARFDRLIWLGRVQGLDAIEETPDALTVGATARLAAVRPALGALDPDLDEIMRRFGSAQVRASGTIGGNIANGSPIGDLAPALIALGADVELAGSDGLRRLPLEDFFLAYRKQDCRPGEYLRRVVIRKPRAGEHIRAFKISKRRDEDISAVMGAFLLAVAHRRVTAARVAFGGMAGTPKRAAALERALTGLNLDDEAGFAAVGAALDQDFSPLEDHRASAAYRIRVAKNLVFKALVEIAGAPSATTRLAGLRETRHAAE